MDDPSFIKISAELLERYLSGDVTDAERANVSAWAASDIRASVLLELLEHGTATGSLALNVDRGWATIAEQIDERDDKAGVMSGRASSKEGMMHGNTGLRKSYSNNHAPLPQRIKTFRALRTMRTMMIAGATAAVIAFAFGSNYLIKGASNSIPVSSGRVYATAQGQIGKITLSDGTLVTIAPVSRLTIPSNFGESTRDIELEGEAYFDVKAASGAPFIVRTGAVQARVLGTRFGVRHYTSDADVRVALVAGRVNVTNGFSEDHAAMLAAGQTVRVLDSTVTINPTSELTSYTDWSTGTLTFTYATVAEVLSDVGRWYGYDFRLTDSSLATRHLTASFDQASGPGVLEALGAALNVTMTVDGNNGPRQIITLKPKRQPAMPRSTTLPARHSSFQTPDEVGR